MSFADRLLPFLTEFPPPLPLPDGVQAFSPYQENTPRELLSRFAQQYYSGDQPRVALLGINPGRLGNGRTGIAFTDPVALQDACGIANALPRQREPSSQFVYEVVAALGGPTAFYQDFFLGSLYPLVLLKNGLNYNYYDSPALQTALLPAIRDGLQRQVHEVGLARHAAVCLGRRNALLLHRLNEELQLFRRIEVLDHPRYLMQYKRRQLIENVARYVEVLDDVRR
ncbi:DUF4918 family protein [Hymenobacter sp. J193]|uniref:uracil-DNA glycosylase family protein n=1 Tax=Hymenobacter sp. J193 TaxID=2898429 RepID=UPI002150AEEA|nr:uracil-DNA glycosylase family protein [Hymenobacter sp. J193]MCR5889932.1 DUF4918 family protein [Hymenobacter sp. J193]